MSTPVIKKLKYLILEYRNSNGWNFDSEELQTIAVLLLNLRFECIEQWKLSRVKFDLSELKFFNNVVNNN